MQCQHFQRRQQRGLRCHGPVLRPRFGAGAPVILTSTKWQHEGISKNPSPLSRLGLAPEAACPRMRRRFSSTSWKVASFSESNARKRHCASWDPGSFSSGSWSVYKALPSSLNLRRQETQRGLANIDTQEHHSEPEPVRQQVHDCQDCFSRQAQAGNEVGHDLGRGWHSALLHLRNMIRKSPRFPQKASGSLHVIRHELRHSGRCQRTDGPKMALERLNSQSFECTRAGAEIA